jgi:hypothetical protein
MLFQEWGIPERSRPTSIPNHTYVIVQRYLGLTITRARVMDVIACSGSRPCSPDPHQQLAITVAELVYPDMPEIGTHLSTVHITDRRPLSAHIM